jgi:hypothetical protein
LLDSDRLSLREKDSFEGLAYVAEILKMVGDSIDLGYALISDVAELDAIVVMEARGGVELFVEGQALRRSL